MTISTVYPDLGACVSTNPLQTSQGTLLNIYTDPFPVYRIKLQERPRRDLGV